MNLTGAAAKLRGLDQTTAPGSALWADFLTKQVGLYRGIVERDGIGYGEEFII
ncbi:MAG TPA: hypothetical protein VJN42_10615 [Candidatus Acidoferrum sp.]|nr:hypothetical protein [Candidatus Acidoferrum sp.]